MWVVSADSVKRILGLDLDPAPPRGVTFGNMVNLSGHQFLYLN